MRWIGCGSFMAWCIFECVALVAAEEVNNANDGLLLLARRELVRNAEGVYIVKAEEKLAPLLESIPGLQKQIGQAEGQLAKFRTTYATTLQKAFQLTQQTEQLKQQLTKATGNQKQQLTNLQKSLNTQRSEALKQVSTLPDFANTHELQVHQNSLAVIDAVALAKQQAAEVDKLYEQLKKDPLVAKSIQLVSEKDGKDYQLGPGSGYVRARSQCEKFEGLLVHESYDLQQVDKSWVLPVKVNGKQEVRFKLAGTRSLISEKLAAELGVVPPSIAPTMNYGPADKRYKVPFTVLNSLEIDRFKFPFVRAAVLPASEALDPPVLATSALIGWKTKIVPQKKKLEVTRLK